MKVKGFLVLPSGTIIRKTYVVGILAFPERNIIIVETDAGREYPIEVDASRKFSAVLADLYCQLNED